MCELYAVNSRDTVNIKPNCDLFYQHSIDHPDGWGLSFWQRNAAIVYRSPLRALDDTKYCAYLQKDLWCTECHGAYSPCHGRCYEFYQLSSVSSRRLQWSYMDI